MSIEVKTTCPLGHTCEKVVDGKIERCAWYVALKGKNPQDGTEVDDSRCAIAWQPILAIEGNGMMNNVGAAISSLRNETVKRQDLAIKVVKNVKAISNK